MVKYWILVLVLINITHFNCKLGKAEEDYPEVLGETEDPAQTDPAYTDPAQTDPAYTDPAQTDPAHTDPAQTDPAHTDPAHTDPAQADPAQTVAKALLCFNNNYIYSSCEESYRLTESGTLNVPHEYTNQFCNGPCQAETHLVLDCIGNTFLHYEFYNKATIEDVRDTIKAGCGYGSQRGNFKVARHLKYEEGNAKKITIPVLFVLMFILFGQRLLF